MDSPERAWERMDLERLALLLLLSWLAATISGAAGFGGALMLLPILTATLGVKTAVPVLTIMQLIGNLSRVWFGRTQIVWPPVRAFLLGALPAAIIGGLLFAAVPGAWITRGVGALVLALVALRQVDQATLLAHPRALTVGGAVTGLVSGMAGSAGPLGAALFLGLNLPAAAYVASEAVTATIMHLTKMAIYQRAALIGLAELQLGIGLGGAMILGAWTGKQIIERLPKAVFRRAVEILLVLSALQLILGAS